MQNTDFKNSEQQPDIVVRCLNLLRPRLMFEITLESSNYRAQFKQNCGHLTQFNCDVHTQIWRG